MPNFPILLLFMLFLAAAIITPLWLIGVIRIKQFPPPQANLDVVLGILFVALGTFSMILFGYYPLVGLFLCGVLVGMAILVVYRDRGRLKQARQAERANRAGRKLVQHKPQLKEAWAHSPFGKFDLVQGILQALLSIVLMGIAFFPTPSFYAKLSSVALLGGLSLCYSGLKKIGAARRQQEHIRWYQQPRVLSGFGFLLGLFPLLLQEDLISNTIPHAATIHLVLSVVFTAVMLIFFCGAGYSFFRRTRQSHQRSEHMKRATLLRRMFSSRPQPKETREEEIEPMHM